MIRLKLLVEGQTEETFVRDVLAPHYALQQIFIEPIIILTSPGHRGGVKHYGKIRHQLIRLCREDPGCFISTLFDLYGLPSDFPGKKDTAYLVFCTGTQKVDYLEQKWTEDISEANFIPNLLTHEFEALLFTNPEKFADWMDNSANAIAKLQEAAQQCDTPEEINDSPQTAPSKRIQAAMPHYKKTLHGPLIAADIGLDAIRQACPHFQAWLQQIEALAK